jgi:branched-chain amino acid transport system permease protein
MWATRVIRASRSSGPWVRALGFAAGLGGFLLVVQAVWGPPAGIVVQGALLGGLTALISLGLALVYRANRIVNFAQGDLGAVPAASAVLLIVTSGLSWLAALAAGLVIAIAVGVVVELLVIRRFWRAPRLVLSVATIGLAQVLAGIGLLLPEWFDVGLPPQSFPAPFDATVTIGTVRFGGNEVVAAVLVPLVFVALALFLRARPGLAMRATAEDADRAALLGIHVRRLDTLVWAIAAVLAFLAVFLRAGIVGLPIGSVLGPAILLRALAAAVIGGMERLPTIAFAAVALGVLEQSVVWGWGQRFYVEPVLFVVILVALLLTKPGRGLRSRIEPSTWRAAREPRPVPRALRGTSGVRLAGVAVVGGVAALLLVLPALLSVSDVNLAAVMVIYAVIGLSLVVLTGWAGEVSLGQMAFVAVGAAAAGSITTRLGWDLGVALVGGGLVGAAVAALIGVPVLRRRGLTLAVISLAFSLVTTAWLLNQQVFGPGTLLDWLPRGRIERGELFGLVDVSSERAYYYLCVAGLALALLAVVGIRRSRTGRVLVAIRENEDAARAYGVSSRRATLAAFVVSGFLAAFAGALFVHHQNGLLVDSYTAGESLVVFAMVVIGGLGSVGGALVGALYVRGVTWVLPVQWQILVTGAGMLLVLLVFPGGVGAALADLRDLALRRAARRRGVTVGVIGPEPDPGDLPPVVVAPASAPSLALRVRDLRVEYDGATVLTRVDLDIAVGEIVAVLGTNGSGKSSLLRALTGIVRPVRGTVEILGADAVGRPPEMVAATGVALVPGGQGVFPSLSVAQHLRLARWRAGDTTSVEAALEWFPVLRARMREPAGNLSGGEQHQLALAMALVARPQLLLVDELTLGLAPDAAARVVELVRVLRDEGTTVVAVEQSLAIARAVADRVYFLDRGTVRFAGRVDDLAAQPALVRSVFLADADAPTGGRPAPTVPTPVRRRAADGTPDALRVDRVSKHFGGVDALVDVSLTLATAEIVGVVGGNGAGKTTLLDVVSGFTTADRGVVTFRGRDRAVHDVSTAPAPVRARLGMGRTFQDGRLFPALTVEETVAVALERAVRVRDPVAAALHLPAVRRSERAVRARVDELVGLLHLEPVADRFIHELSTGTRRVVELACVLAHEPRLLLLDEPSSGLAQPETDALAPLLAASRDRSGTTIVLVDHDRALVAAVADRVITLELGRVVDDDTAGARAEPAPATSPVPHPGA